MAAAKNARKGTPTDWLVDRVLRTMINALFLLPFEKRVVLMGRLVRRIIGPLAGYKKRALDNLALIYPDMPAAERQRIAKAVLDNFGRTLIENYSFRDFGQHLATTNAHGAGLAAVEQARTDGQPVLFVTGHFGNYEAPRQVLKRMGYLIGGLYRPAKNPYFNEHYAKTMTEMSGPVFAQGRRGTAGFAKHLRDGGMGTLLVDVAVKRAEAIPFLGKSAMTATSAADIALRTGAVVVPYFGTRGSDGLSFDVELEAPIVPSDPLTMTCEITARLEARVKAHPEQWFWIHRRWKTY